MTPSARVQAAIGILDRIIEVSRIQGAPADRVIKDWARNNRYAGSKDRRAIRELVYRAIRACGPIPRTGRAAMLRLVDLDPDLAELFDSSNYGPPRIGRNEMAAEGGIAQQWLADKLIASELSDEEAEAMLGRAPLDLRVNSLKAERADITLPVAAEELALPQALRLPSGTQIEQWEAYREGLIEVQDAGSQIGSMAVQAKPGETVIDLCAGAGGKTLALAAAMANEGELIAADTDRGRLQRLPDRAERAGANVSHAILMNPGHELEALGEWIGKADAVLVDAPCSGTGTWRRNPEGRWRLNQKELDRVVDLQERLLEIAAQLVRPGGRLVYVTCSVLDVEGANQIARFLAANPEFTPNSLELPLGSPRKSGTRLTPFKDGTDGFFIASLSNAC